MRYHHRFIICRSSIDTNDTPGECGIDIQKLQGISDDVPKIVVRISLVSSLIFSGQRILNLFEDSSVSFSEPLCLENRSSSASSLGLVYLGTNVLSQPRSAYRVIVVNLEANK